MAYETERKIEDIQSIENISKVILSSDSLEEFAEKFPLYRGKIVIVSLRKFAEMIADRVFAFEKSPEELRKHENFYRGHVWVNADPFVFSENIEKI